MASKYLSREVLKGFDKYKYSSVDSSPFSNYFMHPFWNWIVQFLPTWVAPNILTFAGFLLIIVQFILLSFYDRSFNASDDTLTEYAPIPPWVWLVVALCQFFAHQLDGCDGKQARRTKTSSPLGELFDHGLDSWATLFQPIAAYSVFGRGYPSLTLEQLFYVMLSVMFMFFISHWEKYNTGVLFLTWGYDVSQVGMTFLFLLTYIGGYQMWKFSIFGITPGDVFRMLMYGSIWVGGIPISLYNIYVSYRDKTGKQLTFLESFLPLIPALLEFILFLVWANCSSYNILSSNPRLFFMTIGALFSNITCCIIVSGMSNTRSPSFNWLLIPLLPIVLGVLTFNLGVVELYLLIAYSVFVHVAHLHYGISVVKELANHLNIDVFSVIRRLQKNDIPPESSRNQ